MRSWLTIVGLVGLGGATACLPSATHQCDHSSDCTGSPEGTCVSPPGVCAYPADDCPSGLRFADGAASRAGECVEQDAPTDGGVDQSPVGHDEDGDGIDDTVDNCPHVANSEQRDQLEVEAGQGRDGVGDACDPDPSLPGNAIAVFDAMNDGADPAMWNSSQATANGDAVRIDATGYLISTREFQGQLALAVGVRFGLGMGGPAVTMGTSYVDTTNSLRCRRASTELTASDSLASQSVTATPWGSGDPVLLDHRVQATELGCTSRTGAGLAESVTLSLGSDPPGGAVFVSAVGAFVLVDYLVVISRP